MKWFVDHLWLYWTLFPIIMICYFIFGETMAFVKNGETLSAFTVRVCYEWPPIIFLTGILLGMLITHFLWSWVAPVHIGASNG